MTENNHRPDLHESLHKLADENIQAEREDFAQLFAAYECATLLDAWYGRTGEPAGYAKLEEATYAQRHLRAMAEQLRKVTARRDQEIAGLRKELADAESTLAVIEAWRQAEFDKVSQVEDLSDDPFQEGWAEGVDQAMLALGRVLQDEADQVEVAE